MTIDFERLGNLLIVYSINLAGALAVAVVGWWAAKMVERLTRRTLTAAPHVRNVRTSLVLHNSKYEAAVPLDVKAG